MAEERIDERDDLVDVVPEENLEERPSNRAKVQAAKQEKKEVKKKSKSKDKDKPKKRWFRELFSELKKVSWPKGKAVVKQTMIVLGVTIFFLIIVTVIDLGLSQVYGGLRSGFDESASSLIGGLTAWKR